MDDSAYRYRWSDEVSIMETSRYMNSSGLHVGYVLARYPVLSETFIAREILELQNRGVRISIYAFGADTLSTPHEILSRISAPIIYLPSHHRRRTITAAFLYWMVRRPRSLLAALRGAGSTEALRATLGALYLAYEARKDPPNHLHVHFISSPSAAAWAVARLLGISFSVTAHAHDIFLTPQTEIKRRIEQAAWIRTISRFNRRKLRSIAPKESAKIEVIRAGIDPERFPFEPNEINIDEPLHLVSVGRLVEIKGMDTLINGVSRLTDIDWRLSIAGDGPLKTSLTSCALKKGISTRIAWLGPQSEYAISELLSNADIFILASKRDRAGNMDGIPVVLMEALSRGVPVISTSISGIPELLGGGAGIVLSPDSPESIANAIRSLRDDSSIATRMKQRGRARIERGYDIRRTTGFLLSRFSRFMNS